MRAYLFIALAFIAGPAAAETHIDITATPVDPPTMLVPMPAPPQGDTGWSNVGPDDYGKHYEIYVPREIKSDDVIVERSADVKALPRNGNHMTPEGMACASDADCRVPLGCFKRADSGQLPVKLCATPPDY